MSSQPTNSKARRSDSCAWIHLDNNKMLKSPAITGFTVMEFDLDGFMHACIRPVAVTASYVYSCAPYSREALNVATTSSALLIMASIRHIGHV